MIYSTKRVLRKKSGKPHKKMRGGSYDDFWDSFPTIDKSIFYVFGVVVVIMAVLLPLAYTGVIHVRSPPSGHGV
jgi:hypothetical protein